MMVSGPNLNETSIVSGGYGGTAEGIIPTSTIKGTGGLGLLLGRVGRRGPIMGRWAQQHVPPRGSASIQPLHPGMAAPAPSSLSGLGSAAGQEHPGAAAGGAVAGSSAPSSSSEEGSGVSIISIPGWMRASGVALLPVVVPENWDWLLRGSKPGALHSPLIPASPCSGWVVGALQQDCGCPACRTQRQGSSG